MHSIIERENIVIPSGSSSICGWFFKPKLSESSFMPCVVMAHGYGATCDMGLETFATRFAECGLAVLLFDYRGLGASLGEPRQHIDPFKQIEDYRNALTYAANRPEIDAARLGVWGTSYSGGHALVLAATDKRIKCAVSQVPTINGSEAFRRRMSEEQSRILEQAFAEDRARQLDGEGPVKRMLVSNNPRDNPIYSNPEAVEWYLNFGQRSKTWVNEATLQSMELFRAYKPGCYISDIKNCPLMLIVADDDTITPADLAMEAFECANEPKRLVNIPGGHFGPYVDYFEQACKPACEWFCQHLLLK